MSLKRTIPFFILFAVATGLHAQDPRQWTLKECIDHAIENNIQIKQSKLGIALARENLLQSKAGALPSVNVHASHSYNFGRTVDPFTNDFVTESVLSNSFSVSGNVTLFNGLRTYNTIKQNDLDFQAAKYDSDKSIDDISLTIAANFLQILFNKELLGIDERQVKITKEQLERTRKLVQAGSLPEGSLLEIEAQLSLDELQLVESGNRLDLSVLSLKQLLYLEPEAPFDVAIPLVDIPEDAFVPGTPGNVYDAAIAVRPEIKSASHKLLSAEKGLAIARGGRSPTLTFGGSYGTGYSDARQSISTEPVFDTVGFTTSGEGVIFPSFGFAGTTPFKEQINDNQNQTIGFNLTIPVFNGLQTKTDISRAMISLKNAEYNFLLEKQRLKETIQRAFFDAAAALKKYKASKNSVRSMQLSFDHIKKKFDMGMVTAIEFNDAKNKLANASSDLVQAKYDYLYKVKILEFYQGTSLSFP